MTHRDKRLELAFPVDAMNAADTATGLHRTHLGFPRLVAISRAKVLATTWAGRCLLIDVETAEAWPQSMVELGYAGNCLQSPVVGPGERPICAVATRAAWAGVWKLGADTARRIYTRHGSANAVALSPDARLLAIGTGYYPLASVYPKCALEVWSIDGDPVLVGAARLPDVVIDQLFWDLSSNLIAAWSGEITQDRGHIWLFDGNSLELLDSVPVDDCMFCSGAITNDGRLVTIGRQRVEERTVRDLNEVGGRWDFGQRIDSAAFDGETVFLSTGHVIDLETGDVSALDPLPGDVGVAARPGGGFVGLSGSALLRVWEQPSSAISAIHSERDDGEG